MQRSLGSVVLGVVVLLGVDVLDATELVGLVDIGDRAGLLDDRVVVGARLGAELRDADFQLAVEVQREGIAHLAGILVLLVRLETLEARRVDTVRFGEQAREHLDELVCGEAGEFVLGDVEAMHPVTRLLRGHEDAGEDEIAVLFRHIEGGLDEHQVTFVGVDVGVRSGVSPDAGRDDLDLDGVLEGERERLDVAHRFWVHGTTLCIDHRAYDVLVSTHSSSCRTTTLSYACGLVAQGQGCSRLLIFYHESLMGMGYGHGHLTPTTTCHQLLY